MHQDTGKKLPPEGATLIGKNDKFLLKATLYFFLIYFIFSFYILIKSKYITTDENIYCLFELRRFEKDKAQLTSTPWEIFYYQLRYFTCSHLKLNVASLPFIFPILLYGCICKSNHRIKLNRENVQYHIKEFLSYIFVIFCLSLHLYFGLLDFVDSRGNIFSKNPPRYFNLFVHFLSNLILILSVFLMLLAIARYVQFVLGRNPPLASSND